MGIGPTTTCLPSKDSTTELRKHGANRGIRTPDLLITKQLLYQLSYAGNKPAPPRYSGGRCLYTFHAWWMCGAVGGSRTLDHLITSEVLYH